MTPEQRARIARHRTMYQPINRFYLGVDINAYVREGVVYLHYEDTWPRRTHRREAALARWR